MHLMAFAGAPSVLSLQQNQVVIQWCMNMCRNPLDYLIKIALPTSPLLKGKGKFRHCWEMLGASHSHSQQGMHTGS
ncbi:hypothetical protein Y032_0854g2701 [Ancylostoma ceylanicum]|uniref:Uncharacterized protein n=1 Tax=Ancylostoma ceylanicum TaxID=53326 RepID=A0A016WCR7_9BILA|nr:hypothetical protein Y032_0854g2701 [Ancylostoma ceylanicum]